VIVEIVVDEAGNVGDAKVVRSIPLLDEPAVNAARRWQFQPATLNGQPVKVKMMVTQNFTLK
jgi:protein TonB